jgi:sulfide:quinone oxidoreductase
MSVERRQVVVAGAGVAGLEVALALRELAGDLVSVEVVSPEREFVYRPSAVAEPFHVGEARRFPLDTLVRAAGAELRSSAIAGLDAEQKLVRFADGDEAGYDMVVLAIGAQQRVAIPGALTFRGVQDAGAVAALLDRATAGEIERIVFAVPAATGWPLPLYELALLTNAYLVDHLARGVEVRLVTPEDGPLALFGTAASEKLRTLLEIRGIRLVPGTVARAWENGLLELAGREPMPADAVVALPRLVGPPIAGLPQDQNGFVATDELGAVLGLTDVYAAGDLTRSSIKQGGIAAQQADAVASAIAADLGAAVRPAAPQYVLRGLLLTGLSPQFVRAEGGGRSSVVDTQPLWWPPSKIVGRHLSPFLAQHLGLTTGFPEPSHTDAVRVEVALDKRDHSAWSTI